MLIALCLVPGCKERGGDAVRAEKESVDEQRKANTPPPSPVDPSRLTGCAIVPVQKVVQTRRDEVKRCYRKALAGRPQLAGKIAFQIDIGPNGAARTVKVFQDDVKAPALTECVQKLLEPLEYRIPDRQPCLIVYPFSFSATEPPPAPPALTD